MASTLFGSLIAVGLLWTAANRRGVASAPINRPRLAVAEQASTLLTEQPAVVGGQPQALASNKGKPFAVDMIRPFVRSTIWYNYTKMTSACPTERQPEVACDQAYSVSVAAFNCTDDESEQRKRRLRRRRKKKKMRLAAMVAAAAAAAVNMDGAGDDGPPSVNNAWLQSQSAAASDDDATVGPLSDGRGPFVVPADQLSLLYTVPHEASSPTTVTEMAKLLSTSDGGTPGTAAVPVAASTSAASSTVMAAAAASTDGPSKSVEEDSPDYDVDR